CGALIAPPTILCAQVQHLKPSGLCQTAHFARGVLAVVAVGGEPITKELAENVGAISAQKVENALGAGNMWGGQKQQAAGFEDAIDFSQDGDRIMAEVLDDFAAKDDVEKMISIRPGSVL